MLRPAWGAGHSDAALLGARTDVRSDATPRGSGAAHASSDNAAGARSVFPPRVSVSVKRVRWQRRRWYSRSVRTRGGARGQRGYAVARLPRGGRRGTQEAAPWAR